MRGWGGQSRSWSEPAGVAEHPRDPTMWFRSTSLVRGSSVAAHCHAATALLTREYQGDHRRCFLTPATTWAANPLDISFHISGSCRNKLGMSKRCGGATETALFGPESTLPPFAIPDEGCWCCVPTSDRLLQPGNELRSGLRMLATEGTAADDALHRFGHVQPRSAEWGVQRHDPVRK